MMSKLYVGNLPAEVTESSLRKLFSDYGVTTTNVLLKRGGYAFIDCADQGAIDKAIDELNGYTYFGHNIVVEPSVAGGGAKRSLLETRVRVGGVRVDTNDEDLENLLQSVAEVEKCEKYESRDGLTQVVHVTYATAEGAREAAQHLNGLNFEGEVLRAERLMDRRNKPVRSAMGTPGPPGRGVVMPTGSPVPQRHAEFPLRILVQSDMVGAIIGRQGATIKSITQQSRARVDVHRKDNAGSVEKAITIFGNPDNCTNACKRILEVMIEEAASTNKSEIPLKILAHNNLIGRIIGKAGATIKKIMEDTNAKITVSSINDVNSYNLERIITIKGFPDEISKAENIISSKLRQCYENDLQAYAPQSAMFPGLHPMAMISTFQMGLPPRGGPPGVGMYGSSPNSYPPVVYPGPLPNQGGPATNAENNQEHTYVYVPNSIVGALIGTKGSQIRSIIRFSGAIIKIASLDEDREPSEQAERKVTVIGTAEAQWKAQYMIFEKIRDEGLAYGLDEVRLTCEIVVPSSQVGRIIGKGGQNVRDLQRSTGAVIKLPQQGSTASEETTVHISGTFLSAQSAQRKIRQTILASQNPPPVAAVGGIGRGNRPASPRM